MRYTGYNKRFHVNYSHNALQVLPPTPSGCSSLSGPETKYLAVMCAQQGYFRIPSPVLVVPHWHLVEIKVLEVAQNSLIYRVSHLNNVLMSHVP